MTKSPFAKSNGSSVPVSLMNIQRPQGGLFFTLLYWQRAINGFIGKEGVKGRAVNSFTGDDSPTSGQVPTVAPTGVFRKAKRPAVSLVQKVKFKCLHTPERGKPPGRLSPISVG